MLKPVIVDSTQCHLWTDALHASSLAKEARNKWDRGTYVRFCIMTAWTALETSCQDALEVNNLGYSFKANLDSALSQKGIEPIKWGEGIWQKIAQLQNRRKDYVHRFLSLTDMFPEAHIAEDTINVVREAIQDIYSKASKNCPNWVTIDRVSGWDTQPQVSMPTLTVSHAGAKFEDPTTRKIFIVVNGKERLTDVFPSGYDVSDVVNELLRNVNVPIEAIRIYDDKELIENHLVVMRGN